MQCSHILLQDAIPVSNVEPLATVGCWASVLGRNKDEVLDFSICMFCSIQTQGLAFRCEGCTEY